jgi:hypothetical protein
MFFGWELAVFRRAQVEQFLNDDTPAKHGVLAEQFCVKGHSPVRGAAFMQNR